MKTTTSGPVGSFQNPEKHRLTAAYNFKFSLNQGDHYGQ